MKLNKVILIGENHYHGLNLVRCFGIKGIKPYGILIGNPSCNYVEASKYWQKMYHVKTNQEAIDLLIREFSNEKYKPVVMPWSDGILAELDSNYNLLKKDFIISSINGIEGSITKLLSKESQMKFAEKLGLEKSSAMRISIPLNPEELEILKQTVHLPLFLKPVTSNEGTKKDMKKIDTWDSLNKYSHELESKGFRRILAQEYLNIDVEYDFMGYCCAESHSFSVAEKYRIWPPEGGAACFGQTLNLKEYDGFFEDVIQKLVAFGYAGLFDMDFFLADSRLIFNEINWRSSANVYGALESGNNYPYRWYLAVTGQSAQDEENRTVTEKYFMNEIWDYRSCNKQGIPLKKWLEDVRKADTYAFWNKNDPKPFFVRLTGFISNRISRKRGFSRGDADE